MDYFKLLPEEVTLEILTRLPTESVFDSKLVCTNWMKIISNRPLFSKMHFHHHLNHPASESAGKLGFLVLTCVRRFEVGLHCLDYNQNHDESTIPIQRIRKFKFTLPFMHFRFLGSINGLVCLLETNRPRSVWVFNPITRECVILPEIKRNSDTDGYSYEDTCFGYVSATNEYKIVGFYKSETHLEIHVYTLGSGKGWSNLGKFSFGLKHRLDVFFANGVLYWMNHALKMIGTFNLAKEKFGEHLSPPPLPPNCEWYDYSMGVLNGFLFFAIDDEGGRFSDIWVLKKKNHNHDKEDGVEHRSLGWRKEFRIDDLKSDLLAVTKNDCVLTRRDNYYINIYDTKTSTSKSLVKFNNYIVKASPHKNTLVLLKELGEKDIKVMEPAQIEETESREQLQEADYIYL